MSNYSKTTDFAAKDSLPSGDSGKIIRGSEFETEFDNISTAIATKADAASPTFTGTVTIDGLTVNGNTTLGNAATDTVTVTADIASNLIPSADDTYNLGASGAEWNDLFIDGTANIDSLVADTADINGGTIDGVTIGGSSAGAITGTTITGTSFVTSGNMTFGDNDKAIFGAGSDLQIYHDSANSLIEDSGTGNLLIRGSSNVDIQPSGGGSYMARFTASGAASLYHNGSEKLTTTSTGIDVTGTVTADGLTVDGTATISEGNSGASAASDSNTLIVENNGNSGMSILSPDGSNSQLRLGDVTDGSSAFVQYSSTDNLMTVGTSRASGELRFTTGNVGERVRIDSSGNVGIGTSSPSARLQVVDSAYTKVIVSDSTAVTPDAFFSISSGSNSVVLENTNNGNLSGEAIALRNIDNSIALRANGTEAMRITSNGNVGIGTTSPATALDVAGTVTADGINVDGTIDADGTFNPENSNWTTASFKGTGSYGGGIAFVDGTAGFANYVLSSGSAYRIGQGSTSGALTTHFQINNSGDISFYDSAGSNQSLFWDSSVQRLGIGTTSPATDLDVAGGAGVSALTLSGRSDTSGALVNVGNIYGRNQNAGFNGARIKMDVSNNAGNIQFQTATSGSLSEAMRIDSSGNLFIGKTGIDLTAAGIELRNSGLIAGTVDGSYVARLNRNTSDGDLVEFRKDNSTVGTIGVDNSDNLVIEGNSTHSGLQFGTSVVLPHRNGALVDDNINLGTSSSRFKDLYLSGGAYLGGTVAANLLDDYEEGTWTPAYEPATGSFTTMTMDVVNARYTKIGNTVICSCYIRTDNVDTTGASGALKISGLPFASNVETGVCAVGYATEWAGDAPSGGHIDFGTSEINLNYRTASNADTASLVVTDLTTGAVANSNRIMIIAQYRTTA